MNKKSPLRRGIFFVGFRKKPLQCLAEYVIIIVYYATEKAGIALGT